MELKALLLSSISLGYAVVESILLFLFRRVAGPGAVHKRVAGKEIHKHSDVSKGRKIEIGQEHSFLYGDNTIV